MFGPVGHLAAGAAYLATARRQHASDSLTLRQLAWPHGTSPLPKGVELTWLGTAGFRLAYQGYVLWIDPYVTRLAMRDLLLRHVVPSSDDAIARWIDRADAILVGHTHFDHALDVPAIARRFGCRALGSRSLAHQMALHGLGEQAIVVEPHASYELGPFRVRFTPSVHSKLWLGMSVNYGGELTCDHVDELVPQAYRCGQVWGICVEVAGARIYHQGSADFVEDELRERGVDLFLCGIAGRRFSPHYVERIVAKLAPHAIVPTHYDDFFRSLDDAPRFSFNVDVTGFADEVRRASGELPLYALELGRAVCG